MAKDTAKQHLPIFVGSTYVDLQSYREAVRDALHRLETIVRGMEYFGSKPGSPLDECLAAVRSCKVYVGVFAMRYGSVPEGETLSMTQLEYEEAQRLSLPSLIYIIDENRQPILPKHVETGTGADKLRKLKSELQKRHLVSYFTTEQDLGSKILHDLPPVLEKLGTKLEGILQTDDADEAQEILSKFKVLPYVYLGKEITITFVNDADFTRVYDEKASALELDIGGCVSDNLRINGGEDWSDNWDVYGENEVAVRLTALPKGVTVTARAVTIFGVAKESDYVGNEVFLKSESVSGLHVIEIVSVVPAVPE